MAEPKSTGESIQIVRRALYDLARQSRAHAGGATEIDVLNYAQSKGWKISVRDFAKAIGRLVEVSAAETHVGGKSVGEVRYGLTAKGDLEEEAVRRPRLERILTSDLFGRAVVGVGSAVVGAVAGYLLGRLGT